MDLIMPPSGWATHNRRQVIIVADSDLNTLPTKGSKLEIETLLLMLLEMDKLLLSLSLHTVRLQTPMLNLMLITQSMEME